MKDSATPINPLLKWRERRGLTREEVSDMIEEAGGQLKPRSLLEVENGRRRPSYRLARIIAKVAGKSFTADQLIDFPYRPIPSTKKKAS